MTEPRDTGLYLKRIKPGQYLGSDLVPALSGLNMDDLSHLACQTPKFLPRVASCSCCGREHAPGSSRPSLMRVHVTTPWGGGRP